MSRLLLFINAVLLSASLAWGQSPPQPKAPPYTLTLSTLQGVVKAGSEVSLDLAVKNISHEQVVWNWQPHPYKGEINYEIRVDVQDSQGNRPPMTDAFGSAMETKKQVGPANKFLVPEYIKPGETLTEKVSITDRYQLTVPGKYTIMVHKLDSYVSNVEVKSNTITITVTP